MRFNLYFRRLINIKIVKKIDKEPDQISDEEIRELLEKNKNRSDALKKILKSLDSPKADESDKNLNNK